MRGKAFGVARKEGPFAHFSGMEKVSGGPREPVTNMSRLD
jgi:hypothetical protein